MNVENIHVSSDAENDLEDGRNFYNIQQQGIGEYFRDTLISDIESLLISASVHPKRFGYYRMSSKRFPYSIYYEVINQEVFVVAVLPEKRNPSWIYQNLTDKDT
ncbi:MAG: type II toxin-antitoxin system RelE/ParE family toxin [Pseudomonadota bacterium]